MGCLRTAGPATLLVLATLALGACGSGGGEATKPQPPPVAIATADRLAKLSGRVASDLDAGDTCHAAHAADDLKAAVAESDLPATMRPDIEAVAEDLVDQVNCPPPPAPPPPEKEKPEKQKPEKGKDGKEHGKKDDGHAGGNKGPKPPGNGKKLPPGQAKIKGERG